MSRWTHTSCVPCWNARNPTRPAAEQPDNVPAERCCFCGTMTTSGLYVRHDPGDPALRCAGGATHGDV